MRSGMMRRVMMIGAGVVALATVGATVANGPSSSLYVHSETYGEQRSARDQNQADTLSPAIKSVSLCAVKLPEPRVFQVHDLVSIIVRESSENSSEATLETEKGASVNASVEAFIELSKLLEMRVQPTPLAAGAPTVDVSLDNEFEGEGTAERKDSMVLRIQAEVIDIKPNGNLVLEARKYIRTDKESVSVVLSGVCRAFDVNASNEVLSTQMHDLRVVKEHAGELRKATKKGLITQFLEAIFNF